MIRGSALTPLRESVTALPTPAYWQEGGASSRLARETVSGKSILDPLLVFSLGQMINLQFYPFEMETIQIDIIVPNFRELSLIYIKARLKLN